MKNIPGGEKKRNVAMKTKSDGHKKKMKSNKNIKETALD